MDQPMAPEQIRATAKIKALLNMTRSTGCSEGEAMNAMAQVGKLLATYNLTLDKVFLDTQKCVQIEIDTKKFSKSPVGRCIAAIGLLTQCKTWRCKKRSGGTGKRTTHYCFFGLEQDAKLAEYLFTIIGDAITTETKNFKNSALYLNRNIHKGEHGKRMVTSFTKGMADRIYLRLKDLHKANATENNHRVSWMDTNNEIKSESIVLLKTNKVESEFEKTGIRLTTTRFIEPWQNTSARNAGEAAGNRVILNRPISGAMSLGGLTLA